MTGHPHSPISRIGTPAFFQDPYSVYAQLRALAPVHRDEHAPIWHVTHYQAVQKALRDPRLSADRSGWFLSDQQRRDFPCLASILPDMMVFADPPQHTRLRGLIARPFSPRAVAGLRPRVQAIVDDQIALARTRGNCDVIAELAVPLPMMVITELLGSPGGDCLRLKGWSDDFAVFIGGPTDHEGVARAERAVHELRDYVLEGMAWWREKPGENVTSALIAAELHAGTMTSDEVLATLVILLVGGHETTTNLIGNGLLALLRHPGQLRQLRDDPTRMVLAIEELLRYDSPVQMTTRLAREEIELAGTLIPKGDLVKLWLGAANRDPAQFPDPDCLDLARADALHLSFGFGSHFCVGAALARLESHVALASLICQFPGMALSDEPLSYHGTQVFRALEQLPVRVSA